MPPPIPQSHPRAYSAETFPSPVSGRVVLLVQWQNGSWLSWISPRFHATALSREHALNRLWEHERAATKIFHKTGQPTA